MTSSHRYVAMLIVLMGCGGEEFRSASGAHSDSDASAAGGHAGFAGSSGSAGSHDASAAGAAGSGDAGEAGSAGFEDAGVAGSAGSEDAGVAGSAGFEDAGVAGSAGSDDAAVGDALVADSGEAGAAGAGGFDGGVVDGGVCPEQGIALAIANPAPEWGFAGDEVYQTTGPDGARGIQLTGDRPHQFGAVYYQIPLEWPVPSRFSFEFGIQHEPSGDPGHGLAFAWVESPPLPSGVGGPWGLSGNGLVLAIDLRGPSSGLVLSQLEAGTEVGLADYAIPVPTNGTRTPVEFVVRTDGTALASIPGLQFQAVLPPVKFKRGHMAIVATTGEQETQRAMLYSFALDCRPQTTAKYLAPDRPLDLGIPAGHRTEFNPLGRRLSAPLHGSR